MDQSLLHDSPITLKHAGFHWSDRGHPVHSHPVWEIIYQTGGSVVTTQQDDRIEMHPGMILTHPPRVSHGDFGSDPYSLVYILVEVETRPWPRIGYDDSHRTIGNLVEAIAREYEKSSKESTRLLALMTEQLDFLLQRQFEVQSMPPLKRKMIEAKRMLETTSDMDLNEIAIQLNMSRSSFFAHFAATHGQTPYDYIRSVRLRRALSLLRHTEFTLETVASRCGYSSASHLSRHVKAETGRRPGELRT